MFKHDYKTIQSLKHAKYRKIYNKFIIEGKRIIESALYCNKKLGPVFCTDNFLNQNQTWIKKNFGNNKIIKTIDTKRFKNISETKSPQGIFTVCNIPQNSRPDLSLDKWVYLDKISNPGNIGTLCDLVHGLESIILLCLLGAQTHTIRNLFVQLWVRILQLQ